MTLISGARQLVPCLAAAFFVACGLGYATSTPQELKLGSLGNPDAYIYRDGKQVLLELCTDATISPSMSPGKYCPNVQTKPIPMLYTDYLESLAEGWGGIDADILARVRNLESASAFDGLVAQMRLDLVQRRKDGAFPEELARAEGLLTRLVGARPQALSLLHTLEAINTDRFIPLDRIVDAERYQRVLRPFRVRILRSGIPLNHAKAQMECEALGRVYRLPKSSDEVLPFVATSDKLPEEFWLSAVTLPVIDDVDVRRFDRWMLSSLSGAHTRHDWYRYKLWSSGKEVASYKGSPEVTRSWRRWPRTHTPVTFRSSVWQVKTASVIRIDNADYPSELRSGVCVLDPDGINGESLANLRRLTKLWIAVAVETDTIGLRGVSVSKYQAVSDSKDKAERIAIRRCANQNNCARAKIKMFDLQGECLCSRIRTMESKCALFHRKTAQDEWQVLAKGPKPVAGCTKRFCDQAFRNELVRRCAKSSYRR